MDSTNTNSNQINWFDAAGNITYDGLYKYLYDGEGRLCAALNTVSGTMTGYIYDAAGDRVGKGTITTFSCAKSTNGYAPTASYVMGLLGEQLTETNGSTGWVHTNVFANGSLLATYHDSNIYFAFNDWLGTKRAEGEVLASSTCLASYISLPFGNGLSTTGVCPDATEHHFTGRERDSESGNDYFEARYYSSAMGRFLSPDWSAKEDPVPYANLDDPQSLNLYSYVRNNPLARTDPDGHCDDKGQNCSLWDHVAGTIGGVLNVVPGTVNLGIDAFNAVSSRLGGPQLDEIDYIQPDAHASMGGVQTGEVLQLALPAGDLSKGAELLGGAAEEASELTAGTERAAQREAMRQEGIPTSQQPVSQEMTEAGRQYTYETPEGTKIVQRNTGTDRSHPGQPHVEAGKPKPGGQRDRIGRPRLQNDKTKVVVKKPNGQ